jgi:hypothetical protein
VAQQSRKFIGGLAEDLRSEQVEGYIEGLAGRRIEDCD